MTRALDRIPGSIPDPFCLLDAVRAWDREEIEAERSFRASPAWQALEAAAQACALHQRALADFTRHAFLLSIQRFPLEPARLEGRYAIAGRVLGQSGQSALYRVRLAPLSADPSALQCCLEGQIAIGLAPYGERFRQDRLEASAGAGSPRSRPAEMPVRMPARTPAMEDADYAPAFCHDAQGLP